MQRLNQEIINFFLKQGYVIVSTLDKNGFPHSSCKGIVKVTQNGKVYLLDLYRGITYENLKTNQHISIAAVDEHKFKGYVLKGIAMGVEKLDADFLSAWEERIASRLTQRVLKNMKDEKGHPRHPEILLPQPEYMIVMEVQEIVDLTPRHLK